MKTLRSIVVILSAALFSGQIMAQQENTYSTPPSGNTGNNYSTSGGMGLAKGDNVIAGGLGIGGIYSGLGYNSGYHYMPNIILSYDNGTFGNIGPGTISLGGLLSFKTISYSYTSPYSPFYYYDQNWTYWILGFRSAYHFDVKTFRFDPYVGLMLAYYFTGYSATSNDPFFREPGSPYYYIYNQSFNSYLALSAYAGLRYYITHRFGLWLEVGYGYTNFAYGINFKL